MKIFISRLILMTSIMLAIGFLANPTTTITTPAFSQEGSSVFIAPGASNPNNDLSFDPPQTSVSTGSTVSWTNEDSTEHTVTSDEGLFDAGPISPGDTFENTFDTSGEFGYHCEIHPFMTGVVIVN
ncbi:MAG: plastocyanin/azurin family copper-binding protein [Nitrososphaerales archaeon]